MDGDTLKSIREQRFETQKELAFALNRRFGRKYDDPKVSRWESGAEKIPPDVAGFLLMELLKFNGNGSCKVIATINQKGGVGKSTISLSIGHLLAKAGAKVLLVDGDSQANLTLGVGIGRGRIRELDGSGKTLYHVLTGKVELRDIIINSSFRGLDVVPSSIQLAVAERELIEREVGHGIAMHTNRRVREILASLNLSAEHNALIERELNGQGVGAGEHARANSRLREVLRPVKANYDFVIIDCMPSLGILTLNALYAADLAIIPVQAEVFSIVGLGNLADTIADVRKRNPALQMFGVVPNMYNHRQSQDRASLEEINAFAKTKGVRVFEPVPRSTAYAQASALNVILHEADPGAAGLQTFLEVAEALGVDVGVRINGGSVDGA
ncbi:MAG: AAA family ATPase [Rhodospirillaceae bacterium]